MSISKRNSEAYSDPTAYTAMTRIQQEERLERLRKIVFICSPLKGNIKSNTAKARDYCRFALKEGYLPIAVHLLFPQFMDDHNRDDRELAISMGLQVLAKCNAIWVFGSYISEGMKREIAEANRLGIIIRQFNKKMEEEFNEQS